MDVWNRGLLELFFVELAKNRVCVLIAVLLSFSSGLNAQAADASRLIKTPSANDIPEYTVQIDTFENWVSAVEYGFELPFDGNSLGVGKFNTEGLTRYVLALGSFYSFDEAQQVIDDVCVRYALNRCQVRYLGRLEEIVDPAVARSAAVDSEVVLAATAKDIPEIVQGAILVADASESLGRELDAGSYTVQLAAMYDKIDAELTAGRVPTRYGRSQVLPISSGSGETIYTVTVGQFDDLSEARETASEACRELELYGCWVKPQ